MPGMRDRNLRSGDLHEELGIFLLKAVALVAAVPRQEDVGCDAFATLIRPEDRRRLIPDRSFLVQLKAASVRSVIYDKPDAIAWITALEVPLFIGRVDLKKASIELFSTQRLHQVLLEQQYEFIELLLDVADEAPPRPKMRRANLGAPVLAWSLGDMTEPGFMEAAYSVLKPHVQHLAQNRVSRDFQFLTNLDWETGKPPIDNGTMITMSPNDDIIETLSQLAPRVQRLLAEVGSRKRFRDLPAIHAFCNVMRRWGHDPDPRNISLCAAGMMAEGPEITVEEAIRMRHAYAWQQGKLSLNSLAVTDDLLVVIPDDVVLLGLGDTLVTDAGLDGLLRLRLTHLNLAGTVVTDAGIPTIASFPLLERVSLERTGVTADGVARLQAARPSLSIHTGPGS